MIKLEIKRVAKINKRSINDIKNESELTRITEKWIMIITHSNI